MWQNIKIITRYVKCRPMLSELSKNAFLGQERWFFGRELLSGRMESLSGVVQRWTATDSIGRELLSDKMPLLEQRQMFVSASDSIGQQISVFFGIRRKKKRRIALSDFRPLLTR